MGLPLCHCEPQDPSIEPGICVLSTVGLLELSELGCVWLALNTLVDLNFGNTSLYPCCKACSFLSSLLLEFSLLKPGFLKSPCSTFLFIHLTLSKFHSIALDSWLEPKILWEDLSSFNYFLLSSPQALFFLLYHCYMNLSIQWSTYWQFSISKERARSVSIWLWSFRQQIISSLPSPASSNCLMIFETSLSSPS